MKSYFFEFETEFLGVPMTLSGDIYYEGSLQRPREIEVDTYAAHIEGVDITPLVDGKADKICQLLAEQFAQDAPSEYCQLF